MLMSDFVLDPRLANTCFFLKDWSLSRVLLKNTEHYPWLILVPRENNVTEISQLSDANRYTLINEIAKLSEIMKSYFKPDKLNVGSLGNMVPQLHIHVIARFKEDAAWPFGVWQKEPLIDKPYIDKEKWINDLRDLIQSSTCQTRTCL